MSDNIDDYDDFDIEDYKSKPLAFQKSMEEFQLLVPTLDEEGKFFVGADDLANWLSENQDMRPPGSGPDGEWTVGDEEAAMANFEDGMDFGGREPYDVLADKLDDQGYDFSPEGENARTEAKRKEALDALTLMSDDGTFALGPGHPDHPDYVGRAFPEATDEERAFSLEQARQTMEELHSKMKEAKLKPSSSQYPNELSRTVTQPDGFVEFDEEVFPDPERDKIMGDTFRALREASAKRAMAKQKEASRKGKQDTTSTLGPTFQEQ